MLSPISEDKDDDTISVYVFGEDEDELENEAHKNGGFLKYEHLANQFGDGTLKNVRICISVLHASELISARRAVL